MKFFPFSPNLSKPLLPLRKEGKIFSPPLWPSGRKEGDKGGGLISELESIFLKFLISLKKTQYLSIHKKKKKSNFLWTSFLYAELILLYFLKKSSTFWKIFFKFFWIFFENRPRVNHSTKGWLNFFVQSVNHWLPGVFAFYNSPGSTNSPESYLIKKVWFFSQFIWFLIQKYY